MTEPAEMNLPQWVVGVVSGGIIAVLGYLARFVFRGMFERLDRLKAEVDEANAKQLAEIRGIGMTVHVLTTTQAVFESRLARVESEFSAQRVK